MKKLLAVILSLCFLLPCFSLAGFCEDNPYGYASEKPEELLYGFALADDGCKIEYAVYGDLDAEPLLMLPPNGNNMHSFDYSVLPELSRHFKVITVSPRGTGNSERGKGKLTFERQSKDVSELLDELKIEKTNIFGFSDGGNLALTFAVNYPERVNSLVVMGANINPAGTKFFTQVGIVFEYLFLAVKAKITGSEEIALERDIQKMMVTEPRLTFRDLRKISVPTLNIYGESDMMYRSHSKKITSSISGAREVMVKGGGHSSCFNFKFTVILPAMLSFYEDNGVL